MNPHYSMALINLCVALALGAGLCMWRFFLKKKVNFFYLLLLVSVLPLLSMLRPGPFESGDLALHATRAMSFYDTLTTFHHLPTWSAELNLGYGDTFFEFLYVTPYALISLFHALGASFIDSAKLVFATTFIASGLCMYGWIRQRYGDKAGFISAIFYLFAPYHLVDVHFRGTIAESSAFLFLPLLLWIVDLYFKTLKKKYLIVMTVAYALFLMTHSVIFIAFSPFLAGYMVLQWWALQKRRLTTIVWLCGSLAASFALSAFYWLPILLEARFTYQSLETGIQFDPLWAFIISPWRYGFLFQGHSGELSFIVGYTQLLVVVLAVIYLFKRRMKANEKTLVAFCLVGFAACFTMMQSFTYPLWTFLPLLKNFQFAYRLLELVVFFVAAIAGMTVLKIRSTKIALAVCVVTIMYSVLNWGNRGTIPSITDETLRYQLLHGPTVTGWFEPTAPIWVNREDVSLLQRRPDQLEVVRGDATIEVKSRMTLVHEYVVDARTPTLLRDNTFYFPGWTVYVDGQKVELLYDTQTYSGVIHFTAAEGRHSIRVVFEDTPVRRTAKQISFVSLGLLVIASCTLYTRSRPGIDRG